MRLFLSKMGEGGKKREGGASGQRKSPAPPHGGSMFVFSCRADVPLSAVRFRRFVSVRGDPRPPPVSGSRLFRGTVDLTGHGSEIRGLRALSTFPFRMGTCPARLSLLPRHLKVDLLFRPYHIVVHWSVLLLRDLPSLENEFTHIVVPPDMNFAETLPSFIYGLPVNANFPVRLSVCYPSQLSVHRSLPPC